MPLEKHGEDPYVGKQHDPAFGGFHISGWTGLHGYSARTKASLTALHTVQCRHNACMLHAAKLAVKLKLRGHSLLTKL